MGQEISTDISAIPQEDRDAVLEGDFTMQSVVKALTGPSPVSNIVIIAGAGLSVAAGIPDFRSPGTGLYDSLAKSGLPYPEAVFDISYFRKEPRPFFELARSLHPGQANLKPTLAHYFLSHLASRGQVRRVYTQNIDTLERRAGIPAELLVEAHGSFASGTCTSCGAVASGAEVEAGIFGGGVDVVHRCPHCGGGGVVKPDITFFGEELPPRFHQLHGEDMAAADLVLVLGSSLSVAPACDLHKMAGPLVPRVLINREPAGVEVQVGGDALLGLSPADMASVLGGRSTGGFRFNHADNYRDIFLQGDCDDIARALAVECGWEAEVLAAQAAGNAALEAAPTAAHQVPVQAAAESAAPPAQPPPAASHSPSPGGIGEEEMDSAVVDAEDMWARSSGGVLADAMATLGEEEGEECPGLEAVLTDDSAPLPASGTHLLLPVEDGGVAEHK